MSKLCKRASLLSCLVLLTGCETTRAVTADPRLFLCPGDDGRPAAIAEVSVSRKDRLTEGTASQIEGNNLALRAICGAPPPPPSAAKKDAPVSGPRKAPPAPAASPKAVS